MKMIRTRIFFSTLRSVLTDHFNEVGATNLFLLFILAIITFYPMFFGGFTTHDDAYMGIICWNGITWEIIHSQSVEQGRFMFFWGIPFSALPFVTDNRIWYLTIKFGSFFLLLSALYYAIFQSFRSKWIALASLGFFLSIIQNGWEHNALSSYAFVFNAYATLFLVSLGLFATAIDRKNLVLAGFSGGLYFFALGTELFVLFFPFYIAVLLSRAAPNEPILIRLKAGRNYIFAIVVPLIAYLTIYLVWRHIYPSNYEGNSLNRFNLLAAAKVVATYSLTAFPLASLHLYTAPGDPLPFRNAVGLHAILSELNVAHLIKPVVVGFLFTRLITKVHFIVPQTRTLLIGCVLACVGIFLPNMLLGFTERHQSWVGAGTYSYTYTYYSFISAVVFSALLLAYINTKSLLWHPMLRLTIISIMVVAIMALSFAVEMRNQYFALDQKLAHRKWQLMDKVIKSPNFMEVPDGSTIFAPSLLSSTRGYAAVLADDWSNYVKFKTGKKVYFADSKCQGSVNCFVLVFRQESHSDNQFIVLKKTKQPDSLVSDELTIYAMPSQDRAVIIGSFVPGEVAPKLKINDVTISNVGAGLFSSKLSSASAGDNVMTAKITGNVDMLPEQITISNYMVEPRLRSFSAELTEGIDFTDTDFPNFVKYIQGLSGLEPWGRWSDATLAESITVGLQESLPNHFDLVFTANAFGPNTDQNLTVKIGTQIYYFKLKKEPSDYRTSIDLGDEKVSSIVFLPPKPTSPQQLGIGADNRLLGIGLISLRFENMQGKK